MTFAFKATYDIIRRQYPELYAYLEGHLGNFDTNQYSWEQFISQMITRYGTIEAAYKSFMETTLARFGSMQVALKEFEEARKRKEAIPLQPMPHREYYIIGSYDFDERPNAEIIYISDTIEDARRVMHNIETAQEALRGKVHIDPMTFFDQYHLPINVDYLDRLNISGIVEATNIKYG